MDNIDNTVKIPLGQGKSAFIDIEDIDLVDQQWHLHKGRETDYCRSNKPPKKYIHRIILGRMLDRVIQKHELVDHKDRNGLNNRRENLRLATGKGNQANAKLPKNSTSGFKGVTKSRGYWVSGITVDYKHLYLGDYATAEDAGIAYNLAAKRYFGEFARFNEIVNWENRCPQRATKRKYCKKHA